MNEEKRGNLYSIPLGDKSEPEFGSPTFDRLDAKGKICPDAIPWDSLSSSHKFYKKITQMLNINKVIKRQQL